MQNLCPQCGAPIKSGDKHCRACGAKLGEQGRITPTQAPRPMQNLCPQCGAPTKSGDKHCRACGAKLAERGRIAPSRAPRPWKAITAAILGISVALIIVAAAVLGIGPFRKMESALSIEQIDSLGGRVSSSDLFSNYLLTDDWGLSHPFMSFRVVNDGNNKASNIVLKLKLGEYTDWESINLGILAPGDYIDRGWNPIVNEGILEITNDQEVPVYAKVEFTDESGELHTEDASFGVEILGRDHTTSYTSYAQYVTPIDPNVRKFASAAVTGSVRTDSEISEAAKEIWDLLGSYGIAYISDPNYFNYAQYPAETLKNKKGDCEDLAILYASLLESIGVKTAIIHIPDHVFAAYYDSQYINCVETTMVGESDFADARIFGYNECISHSSDDREIIKIEDEFDRGIKPPGEIDVGTIGVPIISVTTDADSACTCADYSFWGNCNYYTLNAWGYVTFSNSGDGSGEKCGTAYLLKDGYQIAFEHICVTVPPYDTVTKIISRTMDVDYCGYISCTFHED